METTPAALPAPPLPEEQTPAILGEFKAASMSVANRSYLKSLLVAAYSGGVPEYLFDKTDSEKHRLHTAAPGYVFDLLNHIDWQEEEAARLSLLLEEERRTGGAWVSVDDRLPEQRQKVLLLYGGDHVAEAYKGHIEAGYRVVGELFPDKWWWSGLESIPRQYITHWLPVPALPAAPKPEAATPCQRDCQKCGKGGVSRG